MDIQMVPVKKLIHIAGLYSFFYFEHDTNFYFPGEQHDFWEIVYVDSGEISVIAENSGYLLKQGEIIFHKPNEFHALASTPREPHNVIVTTFETSSPALNFFRNKIFTLNSKQRKILSVLLEEIKRAFSPHFTANQNVLLQPVSDAGAFQLCAALLEYLLIELLRDNSASKRSLRESPIARKNVENVLVDSIKTYLKENLHRSLSLSDICEHYNMSRSYICQIFHNESGGGLIDYYIDLKIQEAKYLIRKGEMNFTQISEKLGYASIHHFSRSFKSKAGMSPSAYEKSVK